jgi:hypothetical protein
MEYSVTKELGTRAKRWINSKKSMCLPSGKLRPELKQSKLDLGWTQADIDDWETRFTNKFEELKRLDETDPEPWINYTAYDFFTEEEKKYFNPDGSIKECYLDEVMLGDLGHLVWKSRHKMIEVKNYNGVAARKAAEGQNHGQWLMDSRRSRARNNAKNIKQQKQDMRNKEEISSLPFDVDADSYF